MSLMHFYETTIVDSDANLAATFLSIPKPMESISGSIRNVQQLAELLSFQVVTEVKPGWHANTLTRIVMLARQPRRNGIFSDLDFQDTSDALTNKEYRFIEYIQSLPIVPVENSPLSGKSFGEILTSATGVGLGAYIGYSLAGGGPFVFVLMPISMMFFGVSAGIARALEESLYEQIKKSFGGRDDDSR